MIEVDAEILRGSCTPVFFVGETIECKIKFRYVSTKDNIFGKKKRYDLETKQNEIKEKDKFLLDNEIDDTKVEEITESMFAMLSSLSTATSSVSTNMSLPTTPSSTSSRILNFKSSQPFYSDFSSSAIPADYAEQIIAWSCAQIDCHCYIDDSKVILPKDPLRYNLNNNDKQVNEISNTSFQPNKDRIGISVYSSKPKILFCNLALRPNESKSFIFHETLPYDLAPTFRGQFAKYSYKLTIGVQKLNRTTQLLRMPFRVYSLVDFEKYIPKSENPIGENLFGTKIDSNISLSQSGSETVNDSSDSFILLKDRPNPFLIVEKSEYENLEYALQILEDVCARMSTNTYNVTVPDGKIVKITINKTNYKIGDKLVVFLDFSEAQIPCVEFKVTLQSEEIIAEECRKKSNQAQPGLHSHAELKEYSLFLKKTDLTLQIPVHITPTFVSDIISLRWRLHFDFALSKTSIQKIQNSNDPAMSVTWRPPNSLTVEVISWDLPILIHPFDPFIASDLIYSTNNQSSDTNYLELK